MDYHGYCEQDWIPCQVCGGTAVDIHHILFKSKGGTDDVRNLIALCRKCHEEAHGGILTREELFEIIRENIN